MPNGVDYSLLYKGTLYASAAAGLQRIRNDFEQAASRISPVLAVQLKSHLQLTAQMVIARNSGSWPGGTTDNSLSKRSGAAVESLRNGVRITTMAGGLTGEMYGVDYLMIHEYGGTMRASNAQYMTIPLPAAMDSRGLPLKRSAREWNNTFVGQSKAGNLIIFQRRGREIIPLYVLKKEVKLKARLGLRRAQEEAMDKFVNAVANAVSQELLG